MNYDKNNKLPLTLTKKITLTITVLIITTTGKSQFNKNLLLKK